MSTNREEIIKKRIEYRPHFAAKNVVTVCMLVVTVVGIALTQTSFTLANQQRRIFRQVAPEKIVATNGASQWNDDYEITIPASTFSPSDSQEIGISPLFARYYQSHNGVNSLGEPLTVAFPTVQGWLQFFASGALFLPASGNASADTASSRLADLVKRGTKDPATGVVSLPLLQELLTVGSQVPVGGEGSAITYVDLRKAASPILMLPSPPENDTTASAERGQSVFVKGGRRGGEDVGHFIPQPFWNYINRSDISPDGWMQDFGAPLTEALPFRVTKHSSTHRMLVQVFSNGGLVLDQDDVDASGQPTIQRLDVGTGYLSTFGPPTVVAHAQQTIWTQNNALLLKSPSTGNVIGHVGQHFPLTILGDTSWTSGMLWYHVQWTTSSSTAGGWISAASITYTNPGNVAGWASFDVLSPSLAAYLASNGSQVGAEVYDVTRQRYYSYNSDAQFTVASSMKVPIMLTFFDMIEQQQRQPTDQEMQLLTTMIENSDNDSASTFYYNEIGQGAAINDYMQKIGVSGLSPSDAAWGYSLITPQTMIDLLTDLYQGKILTASDRALTLNLMEHIEPDQQVGVGDTAPRGALVAMKDGWVAEPDNSWAMNTSGIVKAGKEVYIVSVYTQEQPSLDSGQAIARHVCSALASLLV